MCSSAFQVRIANIIPITYNAVVGGVPNGPHEWALRKPREFQHAVTRQMHSLAAQWNDISGSSIGIVHSTILFSAAITRLQRCKGRHEIVEPPTCSLTKAAETQGAILHYVWIVFDDCLYKTVSTEGHYAESANIMWLPCSEETELERKVLRKGVNHELKHGLLGLLHQIGEMPYTHKDVDGKGKVKKKLSSKETAEHILPHISRLSARFGYRQNWEVQ